MPRFPRPLVDAIFISAPDRFEVGPDDHFEVGKIYQMSRASLERWIGLGRARAATPEEVSVTAAEPAAAEPPSPPKEPSTIAPVPTTTGADDGASPKAQDAADQIAIDAAALLAALEADPRMNFMAFSADARKILGDDMPAKKVEIIAALKALAEPDQETPPAV